MAVHASSRTATVAVMANPPLLTITRLGCEPWSLAEPSNQLWFEHLDASSVTSQVRAT
jgi:hypothetical protein